MPAAGYASTATSSRRPQHARIEPRQDGVWVEDLGSTNGTFLNGERITAERLEEGDVVRVGQTELRLET